MSLKLTEESLAKLNAHGVKVEKQPMKLHNIKPRPNRHHVRSFQVPKSKRTYYAPNLIRAAEQVRELRRVGKCVRGSISRIARECVVDAQRIQWYLKTNP